MKNLRLFLALLMSVLFTFIQLKAQFPTTTGQHIWCMPPNFATFDNVTSIPPPITSIIPWLIPNPYYLYSGEDIITASNMAHDQFGNALFFINNGNVYDKDGFRIGKPFVPGEFQNIDGSSEVVIVPDPGNCRRFYIILVGSTNIGGTAGVETPFYSILDLDQANSINSPIYNTDSDPYNDKFGNLITLSNGENAFPLGALALGQPGVPLVPSPLDFQGPVSVVEKNRYKFLAASKLRPDGSRLVFVANAAYLFCFKINASGVSFHSFQQVAPSYQSRSFRAELELYEFPDGHYRIAMPLGVGGLGLAGYADYNIFCTELNTNGDIIPLSENLITLTSNTISGDYTTATIKGLEFSPNGNYLYFNHIPVAGTSPNPVEYFNFITDARYTIPSLSNPQNFYKSHIEMGEDGHMYWVKNDGLSWGVLNNPDMPTLAGNFQTISAIGSPLNYPLSAYGFGIGGQDFELHTLPDQIDGMNYYDYLSPNEQCCFASNYYDQTAFTAGPTVLYPGNNQIWTGAYNPLNNNSGNTVYVKNRITIPAGMTVEIQNMFIYFAPRTNTDPGGELIIERGTGTPGTAGAGGKLILNNTLLSADINCTNQAMWRGVQVHGYQTLSQLPPSTTKQGRIELKNNSIIEHAFKGIVASKTTSGAVFPFPLAFNFTYDGGIIKASNSTFRNNEFDIDMRKYIVGTVNQSFFRNCTFKTDAALNIPTLFPKYHVYLNDLKNINFLGCDFKNTTLPVTAIDATPIGQLGWGILSIDAAINVQNNCNCFICPVICPPALIDNSNFLNLEYGIYADNSLSLRTVTCRDANFSNNRKGILLRGIPVANILKNNFYIYKSVLPNSTTKVYGLFLQTCSGYKVEENLFQDINHASITAIGNSWGVIVENTGDLIDNEIYKNTFQNLYIGGQSQGNNGKLFIYDPNNPYPPRPGLRWKCNVFNDKITSADLTVTNSTLFPFSFGRIAYDQGFCFPSDPNATQYLAGNEFNHVGTPPIWELSASSGVQSFHYAYHNDFDLITQPNFVPYNYNPPTIIVTELCSAVYYNMGGQSCPSQIVVKSMQALVAEIIAYRTEIAQKKTLIDGGSTANLLAYINSPSNSIGQKKNMLLSKSPYLSDAVLIAYLNINTPPGHLQQVLLANSGITDQVWEVVESKSLPNGIKSSINTARSTIGVREKLYQNLALLNSQKSHNIYEVVGYYLRDTISVSPLDSIIAVLSQEEDRAFLEMLCNVNMEKGALAEASSIKNELVAHFGEDNTTKMIELNIELEPLPSKCFGIITNPDLRAKTFEIAYDENDKLTQVYARTILSLAYDSIFPEIIEDILNANSMPINGNNNSDEVLPSIIKIYPNPALEELYIEAITNTSSTEVWSFMMVTVTDMQGRVLITKNNPDGWTFLTLALSNIQAGNYIVKVSDLFGNFEVKTFIKVQ